MANELIINNFQTGIAESAYKGFADMRNVDIFSSPGALKISNSLVAAGNSSSVVTGLIVRAIQDPQDASGAIYSVDQAGVLYKEVTGGWNIIGGHGAAGALGQGLGIWKDYLFYARDSKIDVYGPLSGAPAWTNDWQTIESSVGYNLHPIFAGSDDFLYIGNAQYVDTINEVVGQTFDPGNPATYTYNSQDLELRSNYRVTTLEELGSEIAIGTLIGFNGVVNIGDTFFWDGTSDSFILNQTIHFAENGVWQMKNLGNILYTIAGMGRTRLFQSTFSQAKEIKRLNNLKIAPRTGLTMFTDAIDAMNGELLFGVSLLGGITGNNPLGVYSYRNRAYVLRNTISTGSVGEVQGVEIGVVRLAPTSGTTDVFLVSYYDQDANQYGVDELSPFFYTGYKARVDTAIYKVGTADNKKTYEKCEIRLGKAMANGDKIRISARESLTDTFIQIAEFTFTDWIGKSSLGTKVTNLKAVADIQLRIELDTGAGNTESPELMEVMLS